MTLVTSAVSEDSIVVGADSLRGVVQSNGERQTFYDAKKHYEVTDNCSILVAGTGFSMERVDQFLETVIASLHTKELTDVGQIADELCSALMHEVRGQINPPGNIVFILAGFSGSSPQLFRFHSDNDFIKTRYDTPYLSAGKDEYADSIYQELGVNKSMGTKELSESVMAVLERTHQEFPNDVGGELKIKVLRP